MAEQRNIVYVLKIIFSLISFLFKSLLSSVYRVWFFYQLSASLLIRSIDVVYFSFSFHEVHQADPIITYIL